MQTNIKILTWNYQRKSDRQMISECIQELRPDIILLQEIKNPDDIGQFDHYKTISYHTHPILTSGVSPKTGVSILVRSELETKGNNNPIPQYKGQIVSVELHIGSKVIDVFSFHNYESNKPNHIKNSSELLNIMKSHTRDFIIGGDWNTSLCEPKQDSINDYKNSSSVRKLIKDNFINGWSHLNSYEQIVPTCPKHKNHIDGFIISKDFALHLRRCEILDKVYWNKSDHHPMILEISF